MKLLKRLRLINWHLFANETCDIEKITFLTGANGTGKSTIIDALQTVLLGDTSGRNFNKAANDKGFGRTLKGYLKCETGVTNSGKVLCIRKGRFSSYIALEFYDDKREESFTIGIVFDVFEDETEEHHFFYLKDGFPNNNFTNCELIDGAMSHPFSFKELAAYFGTNYQDTDYQFFDSNVAYQKFIQGQLGNLSDKYFSLFKKAVGFTPINDISKFITEFICDVDHHIDIKPMQSNIEQYKMLEFEAIKLKERITSLIEVNQAFNDYQKQAKNMNLADYVIKRCRYELGLKALGVSQEKVNSLEEELADNKLLFDENQSSIGELTKKRDLFYGNKVGAQGFSLVNEITNQKEKVLEKLNTILSNLDKSSLSLKTYLINATRISKELLESLKKVASFDSMKDYQASLTKGEEIANKLLAIGSSLEDDLNNNSLRLNIVSSFKNALNSLKEFGQSFSNVVSSIIKNEDDLNFEYINLNNQVNAGHKPFDMKLLKIKNALASELTRRHPDSKLSLVCDLIDIKDRSWEKAIEGCIYNQKFNFIVDEKYYTEANDILKGILKQTDYYPVSLVDTGRLIERNFQADHGSLAEVIQTNDDGMEAYVNYLLGHIKRCESFEEAQAAGSGLLKDGSGYRNFGSWYLNPRLYRESFIGTSVSLDLLAEKKEAFASRQRFLDSLYPLSELLMRLSRLEVMSSFEESNILSSITESSKISGYEESIKGFDNDLQATNLTEVSSIDSRINDLDSDIDNLKREAEELLTKKGLILGEIKTITEEKIPSLQKEVDLIVTELHLFEESFVNDFGNPFFTKMTENNSLEHIIQKAGSDYIQFQNLLKKFKDNLFAKRIKYNNETNSNYDAASLDSNDEYDHELHLLSDVELPNYEAKILDAKKKSVKEFKDDFIFKLRTSISEVQIQIAELNDALLNAKFGRDAYQFLLTPNKDYYDYYQMIMDQSVLDSSDPDEVFVSKYGDIMNNLFALISDSDNIDERAALLQNIEKYTDYRTYLIFDLLVKRGTEESSSLAHSFGKQSGGETQTPFYISILASFAQLYHLNSLDKDTDSIGIVIFDEAFSKMDGARIKESINLLKSFGLQAILSTPSEKLKDIAKNVDSIIVAIHDEKKQRSHLDLYKEIEKEMPKLVA